MGQKEVLNETHKHKETLLFPGPGGQMGQPELQPGSLVLIRQPFTGEVPPTRAG